MNTTQPTIIGIHSFRRGAGKSLLAANLAALLAQAGRRVGLIDADLAAPALQLLCGLRDSAVVCTLNDYLLGRCDIEQAAYPLELPAELPGQITLVPASASPDEIARMLRRGYNLRLLDEACQTLIEQLRLDTLLIDIHAGLHEEALMLAALADALAIVLRNDQQDYQGTAVLLEVARRLEVPRISLVANLAPPLYNLESIAQQVARTYHCPVAGVLPHCDALAGADGIFALSEPEHPFTARLRALAEALAAA